MKNIKIFYPARCVAVALLLGIFAFNGSAQNDKKTPPKITVTAMTPALRSEVEKNKDIMDAIASLSEDGDYINIGEGKVNRAQGDSVSAEVYFKILTKVKNRVTEYEHLVYSKGRDKKVRVFFDGVKTVPKNNPKGTPAQKIFGCGPWSGWQDDGTSCDSNFWCFSDGQMALYQKQYRTRQCKKGIQKATRKNKIKCGC